MMIKIDLPIPSFITNQSLYKFLDNEWNKNNKTKIAICEEYKIGIYMFNKICRIIRLKKQRKKKKVGDRWISKDGYPMIFTENGIFPEHILIIEKKLGRKLRKNEGVHHIDGNKKNNKPENLICFKNAKEHHKKIHSSLRRSAYMLVRKGIIKFDHTKKEYYI